MEKIRDFIKKHPFAAINIAGIFLVIMTFLFEPFAAIGFLVIAMAFVLNGTIAPFMPVILIIFIAVNIAAFFMVDNYKTVPGIILTVLGGSIGAMLGVRDTGDGFPASKAVRIIFRIKVWLVIWIVSGFLMYEFGRYDFSLFPN